MTESDGTTIFCDDIRVELFNKATLIGMYGYELVVFGKFPVTLPKLGIFLSLRFHREKKINGAQVRVYFPGVFDESAAYIENLPIKLDKDSFPMPDPVQYPDPGEFYGFNHPIMFSPAVIKEAGYIRVRAIAGGETIKCGSLRLREATSDEMPKAIPSSS